MKKGLLLVAFVLLACSAVFAGPFGIEMGWSYDQLVASGVQIVGDPRVNNNVTTYEVAPVKTHPSFDYYLVRIDEKEGVYSIEAYGSIPTSEYGTQAKEAYENMKKQLGKSYGKPDEVEYLKSKSLWDEPRYWMMGLVKQDRTCASFWTFKNRKDQLSIIALELTAKYTDTGRLELAYQSDKTEEILERVKASQASVL